jgi:hypothetical protein
MAEKPCLTCAAQGIYAYSTLWTLEDCQRNCPLYFRWEGQQEGYAKGAYEAFRFAEDWCHEGCQFYARYGFDRSGVGTTAFLADYERWLTSRGIRRPE